MKSSASNGTGGGWRVWRNRILASPKFQDFAARFPLTRPIAQRRARALFDLVAGFTYSQILAACVETDLLAVLADGPLETADVATRVALDEDAAERLLRAAASLTLAERVGAGWMLGSAGAAMRGNSGIADMVAHHRLLYADLADPVALLRRGGGGGALAAHWRYAERPGQGEGDEVADYSTLMAASQPLVADQIVRAYPFGRHRRLLDVGGGQGGFAAKAASAFPGVTVGLFDLPAVAARARERVPQHVAVHGGSFLSDPLPQGYDVVSLVRILHDHDDAPARKLLAAVHAALPPGGRVVIAEPMADTPGAAPIGDAYFGMYLLAMGSGRPRTPKMIAMMLAEAGFSRIRHHRTDIPMIVRLISAIK